MDKPIKNHRHFGTTLLALYDLPHQATVCEVYAAAGIDHALHQDVWIAEIQGYVHPAMQAALRRDFPTLAEAVMDGELVIDGEPYVQKLSNPPPGLVDRLAEIRRMQRQQNPFHSAPPSISQVGHCRQATAAVTAISASALDRADIERIRRAKDAMKWARRKLQGKTVLKGSPFDFAISQLERALGELEMIEAAQDKEAE